MLSRSSHFTSVGRALMQSWDTTTAYQFFVSAAVDGKNGRRRCAILPDACGDTPAHNHVADHLPGMFPLAQELPVRVPISYRCLPTDV